MILGKPNAWERLFLASMLAGQLYRTAEDVENLSFQPIRPLDKASSL